MQEGRRRTIQLARMHIAALEAVRLTSDEILDLSHAVAIFAWANRLMLTLGEPVFPETTSRD